VIARLVLIAIVLAGLGGVAGAVDRACPRGQIWDLNRGACVAKKKARRRSPEEKYYAALEHLDGRARRPDPAKGVALLGDACAAKLGMACTQLAFVHLRGRAGATPDATRAFALYEQACALGDLDGCVGAAEVQASGALGAIDHARAIPFLGKACSGGSGRGCYGLARKHDFALGVDENEAKATELYQQAFALLEKECARGVAASCALVGVMYRDGTGVAADPTKATAAFGQACELGAGDGCYQLALQTATEDPRRAYALYQRACQRYDHPDACFEAGAMLALDQVQGDLAVLRPFAERACQLSQARCDLLGFILGRGKGVAADPAASLRWYEVACGQGNGIACRVSGDKYANGEGAAKNAGTATTFWEKACELQQGLGCAWAGKYHWWGDEASGLAKDPARAFELFHLGCLRKDHESCQWAGELLNDGTDGTGTRKPQRAIVYYEAGCTLGRGQSCAWAGDLHADGRATGSRDPTRAIDLYEQSCWATLHTSSYGCRKVAALRRAGSVVPKSLETAARALIVSCRVEGGDDCMDADALLEEYGAGEGDQRALRAAIDTACNGTPRIESACVAYALVERSDGYTIARDLRDSARRLGESCDRGYLHACWLWGGVYEGGLGIVPDENQARMIYTRACDGGYQEACFALANLMARSGRKEDALHLYARSCEEGHASACNSLGFAYYTASGAQWDLAEALRLYEKSCELGDSVACSNVAEMYDYGIAREADAARAFVLYTKACDMGFQGGCGRAAKYLETGAGGATRDVDKAERYYDAACTDGAPDACRRLADLLRSTKKGSASRIAQLYQKAFASAKRQAETNPYYAWMLGTFHRDGVATIKDAKAAAALFVQACEGYDPLGCLDGGRLYLAGAPGLPPDRERAAVQLDKACAANVAEACRLAEQARASAAGTVRRSWGCSCDAGDAAAPPWLLVALVAVAIGTRRSPLSESRRSPRDDARLRRPSRARGRRPRRTGDGSHRCPTAARGASRDSTRSEGGAGRRSRRRRRGSRASSCRSG